MCIRDRLHRRVKRVHVHVDDFALRGSHRSSVEVGGGQVSARTECGSSGCPDPSRRACCLRQVAARPSAHGGQRSSCGYRSSPVARGGRCASRWQHHTEGSAWACPVSYTHLDVYKRQSPSRPCCGRRWQSAQSARASVPAAVAIIARIFGHCWRSTSRCCSADAPAYSPVSYTHLDVYKRQVNCIPGICLDVAGDVLRHCTSSHQTPISDSALVDLSNHCPLYTSRCV